MTPNPKFKLLILFLQSLFTIFIIGGCTIIADQNRKSLLSTISVPGSENIEITSSLKGENNIWRPVINATWQWQLDDLPVNLSFDVDFYDIDLFENDARVVADLHAGGRKVICYVSVGSWEDWRPDADQFPAEAIGKTYTGWAGEKWLDIRRIDLIAPIMRARFDQCREKGFDGIEADNIDGYDNDTGFAITYQNQLAYNHWLADEAHVRGLSIGLKNDADQAADLLPFFDWALTEECFKEDWCEQLTPFIQAGKAVVDVEYTDTDIHFDDFCQKAKTLHFSAMLKNRELDAFRQACP